MAAKDVSLHKILKWTFGILNVVFLLLGVVVFCVGCYLKVSRSDYTEILDSKEFQTGTALCISAGIIVVVVSLLGFFGLAQENQFLLALYFIAVVIIFSIEIAAGIIAFIYRDRIRDVLREDMLTGLKDEKRRTAWNRVQEKYQCCGVNNYTDWEGVYSVVDTKTLPDSCCGYTGCGTAGGQVAWNIGCYRDAEDWLTENYILLALVAVVVGALQIILMISSIAMIVKIRRSKLRYSKY
ncbi:hypothetical protein FSP39_003051 [Pinctada imbricata]|uniref:Tetraspanin n=1 Tax=Pinctada imbricata TaxID=66713 RepID=A0AA89C0L3_PINIB|nr:hypothetical protein FSP39_003051 [Pinctada imbricata]